MTQFEHSVKSFQTDINGLRIVSVQFLNDNVHPPDFHQVNHIFGVAIMCGIGKEIQGFPNHLNLVILENFE